MEQSERSPRRSKRERTDEGAIAPQTPPRTSRYAGICAACDRAWSCAACVRTATCAACTPTARCGACRNVHSLTHRKSGQQQSTPQRSKAVKRRAGTRVAPIAPPPDARALDLPRTRAGLDCLYRLVASWCPDLRSSGGGRWMYSPTSERLVVETLNVKDQYETPAYLWRHAVVTFRLDRDAHASSLNAVLPAYDTRLEGGPREGARYWLNPAYGRHCGTIADALATHVWQRGCAVVALLPALLHMGWWHEYVMRADAIYYLRRKVRFGNPFLDSVDGEYMYSFVLVVWEPTPAPTPPPWRPLELALDAPSDPAQLLRVRRCCRCGKYRVLPRHQVEVEGGDAFTCDALADARDARCEAPCRVWLAEQ